MAARAIWKGVISFGSHELPVKLYSAVQDLSVHFRLLDRKDNSPVRQQMVSSETGDPVEKEEIHKAFPLDRGTLVVLDDEDLESVEPEGARDIEITRFVDPAEIDHRWYERAYYLGPDRNSEAYFALAEALEKTGKEGVARWVMRKKPYVGALRADDGYLMLIALRNADEAVAAEDLNPPQGRKLDKRELDMAQQLIEAFSGELDLSEFRDTYRDRVKELVETKAAGGKVKLKKFKPRVEEDESLEETLAASLAGLKKRSAGGRG
ncbi:MAG: Ku protein [Thermoanaerobaculia bacterium]